MKLSLPSQLEKFEFYVDQLRKYSGVVEVKKCLKKRTLKQNKYLHVLLQMYAIEYGDRMEKQKQRLKQLCPFMHYREDLLIYLRSSADLNTKELTDWIEWIKNYAGMNGIYLPNPDEYNRNWAEYEQQIEQHKQYL